MRSNQSQFFAVTFFSATVLLLETVFFHVLDYVHDYYAAVAVISSAILGIGLGAFIASYIKGRHSLIFSICCLGQAIALFFATVLIVFSSSLWGAFLLLPLCFLFPGLYIASIFRKFRVNQVYYYDMVGAFVGVVLTYLFYYYFTSESILALFMIGLPALGIYGPLSSKNFGSNSVRILLSGVCLMVICGASVLLYFQITQDRFNLFKIMPRDWGDWDRSETIAHYYKEIGSPNKDLVGRLAKVVSINDKNIPNMKNRRSKAYRYLYPETSVKSYENVVGRVDVLQWNQWSHFVVYYGYTNDHFTRAIPKDYSKNGNARRKRWPSSDIRVLYGVMDEPKVCIIGSAAQGILKTIRKITPLENITAVEINPAILRIMTEDYYNLSGMAYRGIRPILGNALSLLKTTDQTFDIITLINAHSTRTIGYHGAPDYLHTQESYSLYLNRLTDNGYILFEERPMNREGELGFFRMLNTLWHTLKKNGATDPSKHFVIWEWTGRHSPNKYYISMIVTKHPIAGSTYDRINDWITMRTTKDSRCNVIYFKGVKESQEYARLFTMIESNAFSELEKHEDFDPSIVTNDRPFPQVSTQSYSQLNKLLLITGIPAIVLWLIVTITASRGSIGGQSIRLNAYCVMTGFAYLFIEIVLIQRYQNIFISPATTFILVLGLCLLSSGVGGLFSHRIALSVATGLLIPSSLAAIYIPDWLTNSDMPSMTIRAIGVLLICITGFLMGVYLPKGLSYAHEVGSKASIPYFFALNSIAGSCAAVAALVLGIRLGYQSTVITACLFFGSAWLLLPKKLIRLDNAPEKINDLGSSKLPGLEAREKAPSPSMNRRSAIGVMIVAFIMVEIAVSLIYKEKTRFTQHTNELAKQTASQPPQQLEEQTRDSNQLQLVTRSMLQESFELGRKFLLNNQKGEGNFNYEYNWIKKTLNPSDNQVRQAGALWGLALVHQHHPTSVTRLAIQRGLAFFDRHSRTTNEGHKFVVYPNDKKGRTGTIALLSLALIDFLRAEPSFPDREKYVNDLHHYLNFLLSVRNKNGQFSSSYRHVNGEGYGNPSPYFDGEILLALMKAVNYLGFSCSHLDLLQSAEAMVQNHIELALNQDPDSDTTKGFFQWGIMAFYEIATSGWSDVDIYSHRAIDLAYWMIDVHRTLDRTRNTAYAYEGLITAWELARMAGRQEAMAKIGAVIDQGLYKLTPWQVGGPLQNEFLRTHPTTDRLAIGGIMNKKDEAPLRVDVTQHQMHAVVLALKMIYQSDSTSPIPTGWTLDLQQKPLLSNIPIINAHEHIDTVYDARRYLEIVKQFGIQKTIILGSYRGILDRVTPRYENVENNNETILEMARNFPGRFIPFVLIRPDETNKLETFKDLLSQGARGLHIRGGLGSQRLRIDGPDMWPLYTYCQMKNVPVFIHFTEGRLDPVQNVLRSFPGLKVYVPHLLYSLSNLETARSMLNQYPNLYTDLSFGYLSWMKKSFKTMSKRNHIIDHLIRDFPDRFLWGTDHVITKKTFSQGLGYLESIMTAYRDLFEQERFRFEELEPVDQILNGLNLPEAILEKVYHANATKYLEAAAVEPELNTSDPGKEAFIAVHPQYTANAITTVVLTGSSLPGEGMNRKASRKANRLEPSKSLQSITQTADIFHLSIETPLLSDETPKKEKWKFYSTPDDLDLVRHLGLDIVELTGNHLTDYGRRPLKKLITSVSSLGMPYFGGGLHQEDAAKPLSYSHGTNRFTFIGFNRVSGRSELATPDRAGGNQYSRTLMIQQIQKAKEEGDIVILHFQWGDEFNPQPWMIQRRIAHNAVDVGADIVVGTHSHGLAGYEEYRKKHIFYGLGNFLFRHDENKNTQIGAMIKLYCAHGDILQVEPIPIRNENGNLIVLNNGDRDRVLAEWNSHQNYLSNPEISALDLNLAYLHINNLEFLKRTRSVFKRSGIGKARIFIDHSHYPQAKATVDNDPELQDSIELGMVINEAFLLEDIAATMLPKAIKIPENDPNLPKLSSLMEAAEQVFLGKKWATNEITAFLDSHGRKVNSVFIDLEWLHKNPEFCKELLGKHPNVNLLMRFTDNPDRLTNLIPAKPILDSKKLLQEWANRIRIGAELTFSQNSKGASAMNNYATRYLMTIRNILELPQTPLPIQQYAHKEWGYPYKDQKTILALNLPAKTIKKLYPFKENE